VDTEGDPLNEIILDSDGVCCTELEECHVEDTLSEITGELLSEYTGDTVGYIVCEYDATILAVSTGEGDAVNSEVGVVRPDTEELSEDNADSLCNCVAADESDGAWLEDWLTEGDDVKLSTVL